MGIMGLIKGALGALTAYLELRNKTHYHRVVTESRNKQKNLIKSGTLNIYQPSTLNLAEGVPIQSKAGVYTPQTDEVWHSDARFRKLEREVYFNPANNK